MYVRIVRAFTNDKLRTEASGLCHWSLFHVLLSFIPRGLFTLVLSARYEINQILTAWSRISLDWNPSCKYVRQLRQRWQNWIAVTASSRRTHDSHGLVWRLKEKFIFIYMAILSDLLNLTDASFREGSRAKLILIQLSRKEILRTAFSRTEARISRELTLQSIFLARIKIKERGTL